jgi:hypothetical protein
MSRAALAHKAQPAGTRQAPAPTASTLRVGEAGDRFEREADRAANAVVEGRGPTWSLSRIGVAAPRQREDGATRSAAAPAEVGEVLRGSGRALEARERGAMERQLGHDFSSVRIFDDEAAARSAGAISASAYTVGDKVVFNRGRYAPGTAEGRRLLAHELAHVAQQSGAAAPGLIQRQPLHGQGSAAPQADTGRGRLLSDEQGRIDEFLGRHQVVLLLRAHHGWLDGQQLGIPDIIARVRRDAHILLAGDDAITAYIDRQFYRYFPAGGAPSAGGAGATPQLGAAGPSPLIASHLPTPFGLDQARTTPDLRPRLQPSDIQRIQTNLAAHNFSVGPGLAPMFDGRATTLEQVIEASRGLVLPIISADEVGGIVRAQWHRLVLDALRAPIPPPPPFEIDLSPPPDAPPAPPDKLQSSVAWQGTWHLNRSGPFEHTIQVQLTQGDGPVQRVFQFAVNATTGDVQAMAGVQIQSEDVTLLHAAQAVIKASGFLQLIGGITNVGGNSASGSVTLQLSAGVQVQATFGPVSVTVQAGPTFTLQQGQSPAVDFNPAAQAGGAELPQNGFPAFHGIPILRGTF